MDLSAFEIKRQAMLNLGDANERALAQSGHISHWGIVPQTPCTGVVSNHDPEWLHEDHWNGIDLAWQQHALDCNEEYHDECGMDFASGTVLIGFVETSSITKAWFDIGHGRKLYTTDPKAEYSAIVGEVYTQVVASKWVQDCDLCSPCYPGQGDLQQHGKGAYVAYTLPPDVWGDRVPDGVRKWEG